jgi:hypothetical protein
MGAPPAAALAAFVAMLQAAGIASQFDIANAVAPLATQAQVNALPTLAQIQAAIAAAIAAALAPHNAPAIAAAAAASAQAIINARAANSHSRSGVAYAVVPRADGTPPPNWPAGFHRAALRSGPIAAITLLLNDYGVLVPAAAFDCRNALALHIGTAGL